MYNRGAILEDSKNSTITIKEEAGGASLSIVNGYGDDLEEAIFFADIESLDKFYNVCKTYIAEVVEEVEARSTII